MAELGSQIIPLVVFVGMVTALLVLSLVAQRKDLDNQVTPPAKSKPVNLPVKSGVLVVEPVPLPTDFHERFEINDHGLALELRINQAQRLFWTPVGWLLLALGGIGIYYAVRDVFHDPTFWQSGRLICLFPALLSIYAGMPAALMPSYRFDLGIGQFTYRPPWSWRCPMLAFYTRPVTDIVGVQLVPGPPITYEDENRPIATYQLNLLLDDPLQPRLNLSAMTDLVWTRRTGHLLAEFLRVPLVDQVPPLQ
jgi:hypothetical protein